ncbi:MAG TPA: ADOP family duplicated permease, partial [Bryobacteraceae bacterium]
NPAVLNRTMDINGHPFTVVGVAQKGFSGFDELNPADVFVPMMMKPVITPTWDDMARRNSTWLRIFARLRQGVSMETGQAALQPAFQTVLRDDLASVQRDRDFSERYLKGRIVLESAAKGFNNQATLLGEPILILWAMVGLLLLIACVNIANLTLARSAARQKEMAVRLALGACRASLFRLVLTESFMLGCLGGIAGLLVSAWLSALLAQFLPVENGPALLRALPDTRVLSFTAAVTIATTLLFGLVPALRGTRPDLVPALKIASSALSFGGQINARRVLVFAQVMFSVLLLIAAGLFACSLRNLLSVDTGIRRTNLLTFLITPSRHNYSPQRAREYYLELKNRLNHVPGITSASAAYIPVLSGLNETATVHVEGFVPGSNDDMTLHFNAVLPNFFTTLGVPLLAGHDFTERDTAGGPKAVMVNEAFAKQFVPSGNPVGLHLGYFGQGPMDYQIIGVVKNSRQSDIREPMTPATYISVLQFPHAAALPDLSFYVRTIDNPRTAMRAIRRTVAQIDPSIPISDLKTLDMQIEQTNRIDRLFAWLSTAFAASAVLLAAVGLYGLMAFLGMRRRLEIGIRLALGAERYQVMQLMMKEVAVLAVAGTVCGLFLAIALARFVQSQLFGVQATDPVVLALAGTGVLLICFVAGYVPTRRAARVDPGTILRYE